MATALSATFQRFGLTPGYYGPARIRLQVTGAPTITPAYVSNFATTVDGWTAAGTGTVTLYGGGPVPAARMRSSPDATTYFSRTVTGLTVGQDYRFSLMALMNGNGLIAMGVQGKTFSSFKQPVTPTRPGQPVPTPERTYYTYNFTATATSHVIQVALRPPVTTATDYADYYIDTVKVARTGTWLGTTIRRTDANGEDVEVRESQGGQDTTGTSGSGTMTVYDYESALLGTVTYEVTDGNGNTATAEVVVPENPGVYLTIPASATNLADPGRGPYAVDVEMVTDFTESSTSNGTVHKIIGRRDPIANPGPLSLRSGSMTIWCYDYEAGAWLRNWIALGDVIMLRQPTFPGMDLYFVAQDVRISMDPNNTPTRRWIAQVEYQEVLAP